MNDDCRIWGNTKPIERVNLIYELEKKLDFQFPIDYKKAVKLVNNGRPRKKLYYTANENVRGIKQLLSINPSDKETMWSDIRESVSISFVPFASDNFGNHICFSRENKHIYFVGHESYVKEYVAANFTEFLKILF